MIGLRLGRVSFRAIKEKRDYLGKRKSASWMYMSRLAAQKEWAFMKVTSIYDRSAGTYDYRCCMNIVFLYLDQSIKQGTVS
jgi:hypothetical protein